MDSQWVQIFSSDQHIEVDIAKGLLHEGGVSSHIVNKQNPVLVTIGEVELYVHEQDLAQAKQILREAGIIS